MEKLREGGAGSAGREETRILIKAEFVAHHNDIWGQLDETKQETIIRRIERGCYNNTILSCIKDGITQNWESVKFVGRYSSSCYRIISHLSYRGLAEKIINESIGPLDNVSLLSSFELDETGSATERAEIELRKKQKVDQKISKVFTCRKCGGKETTMKNYQTRAADEDSTLSIRCIRCEYVWRC